MSEADIAGAVVFSMFACLVFVVIYAIVTGPDAKRGESHEDRLLILLWEIKQELRESNGKPREPDTVDDP